MAMKSFQSSVNGLLVYLSKPAIYENFFNHSPSVNGGPTQKLALY